MTPQTTLDVGPAHGGDIGTAVARLREGYRVFRAGWNGKGMWLALKSPDLDTDMTELYVYMKTAQGGTIPWLCSQADLLATDWHWYFSEEELNAARAWEEQQGREP